MKPGEWFGKQFAGMMGAEKVLVQKSGYYSRSAPANAEDLHAEFSKNPGHKTLPLGALGSPTPREPREALGALGGT